MNGYYQRAQGLYNSFKPEFTWGPSDLTERQQPSGPEGSSGIAPGPSGVSTGMVPASTAQGIEAAIASVLGFESDGRGGYQPSVMGLLGIPGLLMGGIPGLIGKGLMAAFEGVFGNSTPNMSLSEALGLLGSEGSGDAGAAADAAGLAAALGASQGTGIL